MMPKVEASRPLSCTLLRSLPLLEDPLGECPTLRRVCKDKSHKKQCPIARAATVAMPCHLPLRLHVTGPALAIHTLINGLD
jgi:hypothetical protein